MQEVGILAESITVFVDVAYELTLTLKLIIPLFCAIVRSCSLKSIQDAFVIVRDSCKLLDPDGPVQRLIRVKTTWVRFGLVCDSSWPHYIL